jgi:hypothetical protein
VWERREKERITIGKKKKKKRRNALSRTILASTDERSTLECRRMNILRCGDGRSSLSHYDTRLRNNPFVVEILLEVLLFLE